MKWSFRIGRVAGIDVYIHVTFLLLLAWFGFINYNANQLVTEMLMGVGVILALFGIVLLHELGHALAARRYGIGTRDIILLPIGGLARLERMPRNPRQELVIALAGPAVNVVLAAGLYLLIALWAGPPQLVDFFDGSLGFAGYMLLANVFMAGFNLLPAFPMDGGRVLRALLAMKLDYGQATQIAAGAGQAMAVLFVGAAILFSYPMLLLIAIFVWMAAGAEAQMARRRPVQTGIPIGNVMLTDFHALTPEQPLAQALPYAMAGLQPDFPVEDGDRLVGIVSREDLLRTMGAGHTTLRAGDIMRQEVVTAVPHESLEAVLARMQKEQCRTVPVVQGGELVGMVTADLLARALMMAAMQRGQRLWPGERIVL